jgi:peptide/nickel transport system substrate-binding protein
VDELIDEARRETDQNARRELYFKVQEILAREVPYVDLWYFDNVLVHTRRVSHLSLTPSGNYDFLRTAEIINP